MKRITHNKPSNWRPEDHSLLMRALNKSQDMGRALLLENKAQPRVMQAFEQFVAKLKKAGLS